MSTIGLGSASGSARALGATPTTVRPRSSTHDGKGTSSTNGDTDFTAQLGLLTSACMACMRSAVLGSSDERHNQRKKEKKKEQKQRASNSTRP